MLEAIGNALRIPELRRKILFTLGLFLVFRILAHIAVPGADKAALDKLFNTNAFLGLLDEAYGIVIIGANVVFDLAPEVAGDENDLVDVDGTKLVEDVSLIGPIACSPETSSWTEPNS